MNSICLYGTVLNSINTIETSLKSVFRSDAEIVVVDGGSKDGTYEKLIELSKEFNLKVYRLPGSSRGLGRDYALRKCPENSYASFFDLDDEYNEYYHKSIEWGSSLGIQNPLPHLVLREYAIKKGGWKNLNYAEDVEFFTRIGFEFFFPIIFKIPINKKEYKLAIISALSGLIMNSDRVFPIVVNDEFENLSKAKEVIEVLKVFNLYNLIENAKEPRKKKGLRRSTRQKIYKKSLIIFSSSKDKKINKAARNIPGILTTSIDTLSISNIAPGGKPRFSIWSKSAIENLEKALDKVNIL